MFAEGEGNTEWGVEESSYKYQLQPHDQSETKTIMVTSIYSLVSNINKAFPPYYFIMNTFVFIYVCMYILVFFPLLFPYHIT